MRISTWLPALVGAVALLASGGCTELSYLTQAAGGQLRLSREAVDIDRYLRDPAVLPRTRELLLRVASIKAFGEA